ncbi:pituitary tumor-transforming gene 1 protein-interacting protein isoform X2 [Macrotis lagotis]|uniref:pituitary tumor-transforming gene 1 protein-interacting protein isoform X2 n=1 Tax=Macrotis lagotis TaxID=92651 RepID=UPI003D686B95
MELRGPARAALLGPLLLLLPLLSPAGPVVAAQSAAAGCAQSTNRSCTECLKNVSCFWCNTNKACLDYPVRNILPPSSLCQLSSARWGVCWVNFEALIIAMSVVGGALLLGLTICCCYCCRKRKNQRPDKEEERAAREREERKVRQEERRAEMKSRHEEIRKKYGLFKEQNPYARFEN